MSRPLAPFSLMLVFAFAGLALPAHAECPPAQRKAIDLSNEADRMRAIDVDGAIAKYEEAVKVDPTNHRIFHKLALAQTKKENWAAVAKAEESATKLAPSFPNYWAALGRARSQLAQSGAGSWDDARAPLQKAVAQDPRLADAQHELADVLLHLGDEHGALVHYGQAIESRPEQAASWAALADLYIRLGYRAQAEKTLEQGLTFIEGDRRFVLQSLRGEVLTENNDLAGAVTAYEEARKDCGTCSSPGQQIAFFNLGAAYATVNPPRKAEAMNTLQRFNKMVCKGAAAARYADQCKQAQALAQTMGGMLL